MKKTILIVDDSESIRQVVLMTLQNAGYNVLVGSDGQEALDHLDGKEIDLVITDLNMPNVDGMGVIRGVRSSDPYKFTPVLVLTTESQVAKKQEAKEAGATGWIVKPFVQDKLIAVVRKVIH